MNRIGKLFIPLLLAAASLTQAAEIKLGEPLPAISVQDKGRLLPEYEIVENKMVFKEGTQIGYRPWTSKELTGKIRTVYHLAGRIGMDDINQAYIDALIGANLPQKLPDALYKTVTILNTDDAMWGTAGIAISRMEDSQKVYPHAEYVIDAEGAALATWGLQPKNSAVIIVDADGKVLFFKEGKLTENEITDAVALIKQKLAELEATEE